MIRLTTTPAGGLTRLLIVGAHSDDIEIGCGATVLRMLGENPNLEVYWTVLSGDDRRLGEARRSAAAYLKSAGRTGDSDRVLLQTFRDGHFPSQFAEIKAFFESVLKPLEPELILTHYRDDRHQDHRVVSDLTWNTFRDHLILEYEVLKYDGDLGQPNVYFSVSEEICEKKIDLLLSSFESQRTKHWFAPDTFRAILRVRGVEVGARYAEAFYSRKSVW